MINRIKNKLNRNLDFKDILAGSSIVLGARIIATIFGFIFNLVVVKYYGSESMGILAIINSFLAIMLLPSLMGLNTSIVRFIPEYLQKKHSSIAEQIYKKYLFIVFILSSFVAILIYLLSDWIANTIFSNNELTILFTLSSFIIIVKSFIEINQNSLRAYNDVTYYSIIIILIPLLNILFLGIISLFSSSKFIPVYTVFVVSLITFIVAFVFMSIVIERNKNNSNALEPNLNLHVKTILVTSLPMFSIAFTGIIISQTDIIMLGIYLSIQEVGIYSIVVKLTMLATFILSSVNVYVSSKLAASYHNQKRSEFENIISHSSKIIFYFSLPVILCLLIFGKILLGIFGDEFLVGYSSMCLILIGHFVNIITGPVGFVMVMAGLQKEYNYIVITSALFNLVLNYFLIPIFGIQGAAFASMFSLIILHIGALLYVKVKLNIYTGYKIYEN